MKKVLVPYDKDAPERYEVKTEAVNLDKWAQETLKTIDGENREEELKRQKKWAKNRAFYRGNQRGFWDANKRAWVTVDVDTLSPSEASILVVNNQFRPQVKTLAKEFSRSQARIRAVSISDSQRSTQTGRFADALIRFYQAKLMPESARQVEAKYLMLCGNSFRYTIYDQKEKGVQVTVREATTGMLPAYYDNVCPDCGHRGEMEEEECPECGGVMEETKVDGQEVPMSKQVTMNSGDLRTEIVDPVEIKVWAGAKNGLAGTPYLRRKRLVRKEFIKEAYPWFNPTAGGKLSESATNLYQFMDTSQTGDTGNHYNVSELHEYDQIWLDPALYANKVLKEPIKLLNGQEIPAGTDVRQVFPDGLYVALCDTKVVGYANENKLKCWVHIPYDINVDGFWADGLEDSVMNQQIINEYTSLSVENVLYNASPKLIINPRLVNPNNLTGRPKDALVMSDTARPDTDPRNAVGQLSGMSLTPDVMMGIESSKRDMREQTGALVGFNGQGDPSLNTATAISIARDSALALVSTPLSIRAEKDLEWCWQILRYVREYWYDEKYRFLLGKYNEEEAKSFKQSKLDMEIVLSVEANSWMPTTQYEKLQNLGAYLTAFGIPLGFLNPQIPQVVRDYASSLYNVPFEFNEMAPDIRIAQKRLDSARALSNEVIPKMMMELGKMSVLLEPELFVQEAQVMENNTMVLIANTMEVEEDIDNHEIMIEVYVGWLKTDEGQTAHPILRNAVKRVIASHREFMNQVMEGMQRQMQEMTQNGGIAQPKGAGGEAPFQSEEVADSPFAPPKSGRQGGFA